MVDMNTTAFIYSVSVVIVFSMAANIPSINTTNLPYQLAVAQTTGNMSSPSGLTSENIVDFEIIQESISDAREDIHENNTAEAVEELGTANKALARITNDTTTTT